MLQLRPATPSPHLTIARLVSLLLLSLSFPRLRSATPTCSLHDNIHTLILLWQRWPLSPSFIPSLISSLAKICPIPTAYGEANANTAGESGGRRARDRHGDKDSDRHRHMHMYKYTYMHNPKKEMVWIHAHRHACTQSRHTNSKSLKVHTSKGSRMSALTFVCSISHNFSRMWRRKFV